MIAQTALEAFLAIAFNSIKDYRIYVEDRGDQNAHELSIPSRIISILNHVDMLTDGGAFNSIKDYRLRGETMIIFDAESFQFHQGLS